MAATIIELKIYCAVRAGMLQGCSSGEWAAELVRRLWADKAHQFDGSEGPRPQSWTVALAALMYAGADPAMARDRNLSVIAVGVQAMFDEYERYRMGGKAQDLRKLNGADVEIVESLRIIYQNTLGGLK